MFFYILGFLRYDLPEAASSLIITADRCLASCSSKSAYIILPYIAKGLPVITRICKFLIAVMSANSDSSCTKLKPKSSSYSVLNSSFLTNNSPCSPSNLFLAKLSFLSLGILPRALINKEGFTKLDFEDSKFEDRFKSSREVKLNKSSGSVIRLLP